VISRIKKNVFLCIIFVSLSIEAHRAPGVLTTIEWNKNIQRTEIIHRIHNHDAELGVAQIENLPLLSVNDAEGRARISLYVERNFTLLQNGKTQNIELIGAELVDDYIFIYQELAYELGKDISIRNTILREIYPKQINQVNLFVERNIKTLQFGENDTILHIKN
jgi:hypothetical protein